MTQLLLWRSYATNQFSSSSRCAWPATTSVTAPFVARSRALWSNAILVGPGRPGVRRGSRGRSRAGALRASGDGLGSDGGGGGFDGFSGSCTGQSRPTTSRTQQRRQEEVPVPGLCWWGAAMGA